MASKHLVIFMVISQIGQWIFIAHWIYWSDEDSLPQENSSPAAELVPATDSPSFPKSSERFFRAYYTPPETSSSSRQSLTSASPATPLPRRAVVIEDSDIDRYLEFNRNQSIERFKLNTFGPTNAELFYSYLPQVWCPSMVRMGGLEDGGKWVCNPWYIRNRTHPCLVYSIGVGFNLKFDHDLIRDYGCRVYAFDPDPMTKRSVDRMSIGKESIHYYPWTVVGSDTRRRPGEKSISDIIRQFRHTRLDVLKVDVEGGEFDIIDRVTDNDQSIIPICQVLIEVHTWDVTKWRRMFRRLERAGFLMFSREVNILGFANKLEKIAIEYSYIHRHCLDRFRVSKLPVFDNFPPSEYNLDPTNVPL